VAFLRLDIANGEDAKDRLEQHWDNWITDDDWQYIVDCGFNTVRLPVG
jgi:aryl-phospho-beta-D-glucosidase BglC (GH1 family)